MCTFGCETPPGVKHLQVCAGPPVSGVSSVLSALQGSNAPTYSETPFLRWFPTSVSSEGGCGVSEFRVTFRNVLSRLKSLVVVVTSRLTDPGSSDDDDEWGRSSSSSVTLQKTPANKWDIYTKLRAPEITGVSGSDLVDVPGFETVKQCWGKSAPQTDSCPPCSPHVNNFTHCRTLSWRWFGDGFISLSRSMCSNSCFSKTTDDVFTSWRRVNTHLKANICFSRGLHQWW